MTTNLDIIKGAMKKIHVLASGAVPTAAQAADGMAALKGLYVELIGQGSLGRLYDVLATADLTAREWTRIRCDGGVLLNEDGRALLTEAGKLIILKQINITLPLTITPQSSWNCWDYGEPGPDYGWWFIDGFCNYPRPPINLAPVVVIDSAGIENSFVYVANKGGWTNITLQAQQDPFPFGAHLEQGFMALLAERICDDFAQDLGASTQRQAANCRLMLSAKYDSASRPTRACYF